MRSITNPEYFSSYCSDASNLQGSPDKVVIPESIEELKTLLRECNEQGTKVAFSGNGTGLVGGRVAQGGTLVSLEALRACDIRKDELRARVQAGLSMREFQEAVANENCLYPPDPTEWSAAMGGTFATNASGARTFKYGPTRAWVRSLRVVLADGEEIFLQRGNFVARQHVLELQSESGRSYRLELPRYVMPQTSKHAAGYYNVEQLDAVDLFVGSEGTLGAIVEAEVELLPAPERILGMIIFFEADESLLNAVATLRATKGTQDLVSPRLVEFFDRHALDFIYPQYPNIPSEARAALWIEQEFSAEHEDETLERWTSLIESWTSLADQCWFALDERRHAELRAFRHALPSAVYEKISANNQSKIGTDIAVPEPRFNEFFHFYQDLFKRHGVEYVLFGHIGNCHLHANIFSNAINSYEASVAIYDECIAKGLELGGTVSAEHGIGKLKRRYLEQMWGKETIEQMRKLRQSLDPNGILSPGNMFE